MFSLNLLFAVSTYADNAIQQVSMYICMYVVYCVCACAHVLLCLCVYCFFSFPLFLLPASPNWHHAGQQKAILCEPCRIYYKKYGHMKPVEVPAEPPDNLYKSHYESASNNDSTTTSGSRRKTRNSNGSRGVTTRPGLRSQKIVQKNDSEEEDGMQMTYHSTLSSPPPSPFVVCLFHLFIFSSSILFRSDRQ